MSLCFTFNDGVLVGITALFAPAVDVTSAAVAAVLPMVIALFSPVANGHAAVQLTATVATVSVAALAAVAAALDAMARCARNPVCQITLRIYSAFDITQRFIHTHLCTYAYKTLCV